MPRESEARGGIAAKGSQGPGMGSVRPGLAAPERKIVGIGDLPVQRLLRLDHLVGDALALAIGDRLVPGMEVQRDLLLHVTGRRPAHQRLDRARLLRLVVELPFLGLGPARLHLVLGGLLNTRGHWLLRPFRLSFRFGSTTSTVVANY